LAKILERRHSEELKIFPYGNPINDLQNMIKLWKKMRTEEQKLDDILRRLDKLETTSSI